MEKMTYPASTQRIASWHVRTQANNNHKHMSILAPVYIQQSANKINGMRESNISLFKLVKTSYL